MLGVGSEVRMLCLKCHTMCKHVGPKQGTPFTLTGYVKIKSFGGDSILGGYICHLSVPKVFYPVW